MYAYTCTPMCVCVIVAYVGIMSVKSIFKYIKWVNKTKHRHT